MSPRLSPLRRLGVEREVQAWRRDGDWDAANALLLALRPNLTELAGALGMLYADDQATRAIKAALHQANPQSSPARWKRRAAGATSAEWTSASVATFAGTAVHALFDLASVPLTQGAQCRLSVSERAVLRLQAANVLDEEPVAYFLGVDLADLDRRCVEIASEPAPRTGLRRLAPAAGMGGLLSVTSGLAAAFAAPMAAAAVAVGALVIGVTASGIALQRADTVPAPTVTATESSDPATPVTPGPATVIGEVQESVEGPFDPSVQIPGLNVPTVEVDSVRIEDVLPAGKTLEDELVPLDGVPSTGVPVPVPSEAIVPSPSPLPLPSPTDLPAVPGDLVETPVDVLPSDLEVVEIPVVAPPGG